MTHTSTSPNYPILASLDVGRMQAEMEGFKLVHQQIETALSLREQIYENPLLRRWFRVLRNRGLIPARYRQSGVGSYYEPRQGWHRLEQAWAHDEFVLDPTRISMAIGKTGVDGNTFKTDYLMDEFGIQVNKTSRNSVLFMTNIGTSRSSIAYLLEVLVRLARQFDDAWQNSNGVERQLHEERVHALTEALPPLPDFSRFHAAFRTTSDANTGEGDIRSAYFLAADAEHTEYMRLDNGELQHALQTDRQLVSACFVTPYPPGFPILVPGQVLSGDIIGFLQAEEVTEVHGYNPEHGIRVFTEQALADRQAGQG